MRGADLLIRIIEAKGPASLRDLAADLGLPRSTAFRIVAELERRGLVSRAAPGRYIAGFRLAHAMGSPLADAALVAAARRHVRRLALSRRQTAHLGVLDGDMVTYLVKEPPRGGSAAAFTREGGQLEAYCSGIGKALLAFLPEPALEAYLTDGVFVPLTERTIVSPQALRAELAVTRARGYAIDDGEMQEELACVAAPVSARGVGVVAAVSIARARRTGGDAETLEDARHLLDVAQAISKALAGARLRR